jgi:hypothetical protein
LSYVMVAVAMAAGCVIESVWPPPVFWGGERPEVLVAAVTTTGLVFGGHLGLVAGFFAALFRGALSREPWGGLFVAYMVVGLAGGVVGHRLLVRRALAAAPAALAAATIFRLVLMLFQPPAVLGLWALGTAHALLYTALVAVPIHALVLVFQGETRTWARWR